jgi:hypothetical protein
MAEPPFDAGKSHVNVNEVPRTFDVARFVIVPGTVERVVNEPVRGVEKPALFLADTRT